MHLTADEGRILIMHSMLGDIYSRRHFDFFFLETGFDISCKLAPKEIICTKLQRVICRKSKKKCHHFVVCVISPESDKDL